ncbi:MAG: mechanosensitive ion channel family protein [Candidatus Bathyarchaeia archaeon]
MTFLNLLPKVVGAIVILALGWAIGRMLGKGISKALDRAGVDDAVRRTMLGRALERSGISTVRFFDLTIRWFIYLVAVFGAANILEIAALTEFMGKVVEYLPSFIGGVFLLILGFIIVDLIGDAVASLGREARVEFAGVISAGLKLLLYFVVLTIALKMMRIDVEILYIFARALAWGAAVGIAVGLGIAFGWGFKDIVAKNAEKWFTSTSKAAEKIEDFWKWYTRESED